ncbi:hypothetical protein, partial [Bacteroides fragilis]|uniref:hypothetical protein n=1 Tax=Bacteroides fragilis TaxID=817 RepID=UPI0038D4FAAA
LYYLYCLSMFQRTLLFKFCFVSKAGAKVKGLFQTTKCFGKFFSMPAFYFQASLCERERSVGQRPSLCESDCKDNDFYNNDPNKKEIIFVIR